VESGGGGIQFSQFSKIGCKFHCNATTRGATNKWSIRADSGRQTWSRIYLHEILIVVGSGITSRQSFWRRGPLQFQKLKKVVPEELLCLKATEHAGNLESVEETSAKNTRPYRAKGIRNVVRISQYFKLLLIQVLLKHIPPSHVTPSRRHVVRSLYRMPIICPLQYRCECIRTKSRDFPQMRMEKRIRLEIHDSGRPPRNRYNFP
jgi:hypothetical protein